MRSPADTRSPTRTATSLTVPAADAGTSSVALSDSSVMSGSSAATTSPAVTCTSMTGTSMKWPMSGTVISTSGSREEGASQWSGRRSEQETAYVCQQVAQVPGEPGGQRPVDDPVVVGQRDRQHQPRQENRPVPDRRGPGPDHAQYRHLGGVDDGREGGPADAAQAGDREAGALQVGQAELALPGPRRDGAEFPAELKHALAVHVADHRHHQPLWCVHGDAEVVVALVDQRVLLRRQR